MLAKTTSLSEASPSRLIVRSGWSEFWPMAVVSTTMLIASRGAMRGADAAWSRYASRG